MPWDWFKEDYHGLMYCVIRESQKFVPIRENVLDLIEQGRIRNVVKAIYQALLAEDMQYTLEPVRKSEHSSSADPMQNIRTPSEIVCGNPKEGTCLDLTLFFCGVCLGYGLLPVLIVLEGHALVAVSQNFDLRRWERRGIKEQMLFRKALVDKDEAEELVKLIISGSYLAVECTGFACSYSLCPPFPEGIGRGPDGLMTFERALKAGKEHFETPDEALPVEPVRRKFICAIDYGTVYRFLGIDPLSEADAGSRPFHRRAAAMRSPDSAPLPYLLNRSEQEMALRKAMLAHHTLARRRPLVCLIHGGDLECHEEFLSRLEKVSLPKILAFWHPQKAKEEGILRVTMELSMNQITSQNWKDVFWGDLAAGLTYDRDTPRDTVVNLISRRKLAVMIDGSLFSEQLDGVPLDRLDLFFKFWNEWENISEDLLLIVCLNLKYQQRFERGWRNLFFSSLNDKLRRYVEELDFKIFNNIQGVCLPQLEAINQTDATAAVKHAYNSQNGGITERDVIRLYNQSRLCDKNGRIPMFYLLEHLLEPVRTR